MGHKKVRDRHACSTAAKPASGNCADDSIREGIDTAPAKPDRRQKRLTSASLRSAADTETTLSKAFRRAPTDWSCRWKPSLADGDYTSCRRWCTGLEPSHAPVVDQRRADAAVQFPRFPGILRPPLTVSYRFTPPGIRGRRRPICLRLIDHPKCRKLRQHQNALIIAR